MHKVCSPGHLLRVTNTMRKRKQCDRITVTGSHFDESHLHKQQHQKQQQQPFTRHGRRKFQHNHRYTHLLTSVHCQCTPCPCKWPSFNAIQTMLLFQHPLLLIQSYALHTPKEKEKSSLHPSGMRT